MDTPVRIEPRHQVEQFTRRGFGGQQVEQALHPGPRASFFLVPNVDLAARVFADQDRGETGNRPPLAGEIGHLVADLRADLLGKRFSVQNRGTHLDTSFSGLGCRGQFPCLSGQSLL